jgi:uncharacterized protein (DUF433 family)
MTLVETWAPKAPPLREDDTGTVRIGKTRVTLDTLVAFYQQGMTAEDLASAFDTVALADIHAVISYYLENREKVDAYLAERKSQADEIRSQIESDPSYAQFREKMRERIQGNRNRPE